jgi:CheY-like chemotaxis protein
MNTILILDDEPAVMNLLCHMLKEFRLIKAS